jgi:hypothetical protein
MLRHIKLTKEEIKLLRPGLQVCWPMNNWGIDENTNWEYGVVYAPAHPVRCLSTVGVEVDGDRSEIHKNFLYKELVPEIEYQHEVRDCDN